MSQVTEGLVTVETLRDEHGNVVGDRTTLFVAGKPIRVYQHTTGDFAEEFKKHKISSWQTVFK